MKARSTERHGYKEVLLRINERLLQNGQKLALVPQKIYTTKSLSKMCCYDYLKVEIASIKRELVKLLYDSKSHKTIENPC